MYKCVGSILSPSRLDIQIYLQYYFYYSIYILWRIWALVRHWYLSDRVGTSVSLARLPYLSPS
jgi:hypothetical protein